MKTRTLFLIAALGTAGCTGGAPSTTAPALVDSEVLIELGQSANLTPDISVTFREVVSESRCPLSVVCIWQGEASVALHFQGARRIYVPDDTVSTHVPRQVVFEDIRVELVDVEPYPQQPGPVAGVYRVRLRWSAL